MPHIEVKLLEGKSDSKKIELAQAIQKVAQEIIGYGDESYSISIQDFNLKQWQEEVYPQILSQSQILYKEPGYKM